MQNVLFSGHPCWTARCLPGTTLGAYRAPVRMQELHRLNAGRTAVGTESEDPDPFPEEALCTDINDQGRRHRAAAAIQADRQALTRMQASGDIQGPLFWLQQAMMFACVYSIVKVVGKGLGWLVGRVLMSDTGVDKVLGAASLQTAGFLPLQETPLKGWLLLCLYMVTSWRLPSADLRSIGGWIKFSLQLIMLLGFYWYLSNPVSLPYIAHPTVQAGAWCTVLAAAAVHRRSDMALRYLNKKPTKHLVTQGPYAIHRIFIVCTIQANKEEEELVQRFQNEYVAYQSHVPGLA